MKCHIAEVRFREKSSLLSLRFSLLILRLARMSLWWRALKMEVLVASWGWSWSWSETACRSWLGQYLEAWIYLWEYPDAWSWLVEYFEACSMWLFMDKFLANCTYGEAFGPSVLWGLISDSPWIFGPFCSKTTLKFLTSRWAFKKPSAGALLVGMPPWTSD